MWIARDPLRALLLHLGIFESPVKICISKAGVRIVFGQSAVTPGGERGSTILQVIRTKSKIQLDNRLYLINGLLIGNHYKSREGLWN